jgi:hypothetical protein
VSRVEELRFSARFAKPDADRYRELIKEAGLPFFELNDGETMTLNYKVALTYFGDVARKLDFFHSLLKERKCPIDVDLEELRHGRSVLVSLIDTMAALQELTCVGEPPDLPQAKKNWFSALKSRIFSHRMRWPSLV